MVFGRCILRRIPNCQLGGDGGRGIYPGNPSPTSVHNPTRSSEKNQVKLRRCLKYHAHQWRCMIYLNTHWQSTLGSAAVRETSPLAEPPLKDFTDAKTDYSKKRNKIQQFFYISTQFLCEFQSLSNNYWFPISICIIGSWTHAKCISKIHAEQILSDIGRKNRDSGTSFVRNSGSFVKIRTGFAKRTERMRRWIL